MSAATLPTRPPPSAPARDAVDATARLDEPLSRRLWLVKWFLPIPHAVILAFLWPAFVAVMLVAMGAIVITRRYPRALFDYPSPTRPDSRRPGRRCSSRGCRRSRTT